jgi:hypothetical protein
MEYHATAALGKLPGGLAAGQPSTSHMYRTSLVSPHILRIAPLRSKACRTRATSKSRLPGGPSLLVPLAVLCLTVACSSAPPPGTAPRPEEAWIATTCLPAAPDTAGWTVHRFSDLELAVPAEFTVRNRTSRSIEFVHLSSVLSFLVGTSPTREIFYPAGRPAKSKEETGCSSGISGYPGVVMAVARANTFSVVAEWDGGPLWGIDDWRKRLVARIGTSRLRDAQQLRDALHTIRVVRDSSLTRRN